MPWFKDRTPYVVAYVELEEGLSFTTNIIGGSWQHARIGAAVEVVFEPVGEGIAVPVFRLV